jgi:DNA-binding IclR family transcriptional regulator
MSKTIKNSIRNAENLPEEEDWPEPRLSSVAMAIKLLNAFSAQDAEMGISALSKRLGIAKSTVHRLATTLASGGLLEQTKDSRKYRLGITLFRLGALVRQRMDLYNEAKPFLLALGQRTGETIHLAILNERQVIYVYNLESEQAIRARSYIGVPKPAYCAAEGLAILAYQPSDMIDAVIADGLHPRTPNTITSPTKFRAALQEVRQRGVAIEDEEAEIGVRCIAAPVWDSNNAVVAAIGVAGPAQRLTKKALNAMAPDVIRTAQAISSRMGFRLKATA